MLQIIWNQHDKSKILNAKSGHQPVFSMPRVLVGADWSSRPCFDMLCIPTNYLPLGATGSHFNLWCLLQWDIAGFKTGNRGGTTLKNLYTQQTWINFKPTHRGKQKGLSKKSFYPHCCFILQWLLIARVDASFKEQTCPQMLHQTWLPERWNVLFYVGPFKGCWAIQEMDHGNLMFNHHSPGNAVPWHGCVPSHLASMPTPSESHSYTVKHS